MSAYGGRNWISQERGDLSIPSFHTYPRFVEYAYIASGWSNFGGLKQPPLAELSGHFEQARNPLMPQIVKPQIFDPQDLRASNYRTHFAAASVGAISRFHQNSVRHDQEEYDAGIVPQPQK
jgi:hypothetical protein